MRALIDIVESKLPAGFEHSDWGYWIESDGAMRPVGRHRHCLVYRIGWEALASGRIRVTAVGEELRDRTDSGKRVLAADFFANFVTKRALRSLMALLVEYDFEDYGIGGLAYSGPDDMSKPQRGEMSFEDWDRWRVDPRTRHGMTERSQAIACVRSFLPTALASPPPLLDATPADPFASMRKKPRKQPRLR